MYDTQRSGGAAALFLAATFVFGVAVYAGLILGSGYESSDPVEAVAFLSDHQALLHVWWLVIYVAFGVALAGLTVALHDRLKSSEPGMSQVAAAFGLIWSGLVIASAMIAIVGMNRVVDLYADDPERAGAAWLAIETVQFGIGGGVEIVGALWVLLVGWAMLRGGAFPRALGHFGVIIGVAGSLTVVPALEFFGAVFGLGMIAWFVWTGIVMLRWAGRPSQLGWQNLAPRQARSPESSA
jgi:hypothetical protein